MNKKLFYIVLALFVLSSCLTNEKAKIESVLLSHTFVVDSLEFNDSIYLPEVGGESFLGYNILRFNEKGVCRLPRTPNLFLNNAGYKLFVDSEVVKLKLYDSYFEPFNDVYECKYYKSEHFHHLSLISEECSFYSRAAR